MNEFSQNIGLREPGAVDQLQIADLTLDLQQGELRDTTGARIDLRHRSFGVLRHLATNAGRVVSKDELLATNWPGVTVTEDLLTQCISEIRRLLGDSGRDLIRTVPRRGYTISSLERAFPVPDVSGGPRSPSGRSRMTPETVDWMRLRMA